MRQQTECDILRPLIVQKLIYKEIKVALNEDHRADVFELKDEIFDLKSLETGVQQWNSLFDD